MNVQRKQRIQRRIPDSVIEEFCLESGIYGTDEEFPPYIKETVVRGRMNQLRKMEWQRWIPVVGAWRMIKDALDGNQTLLKEMHSNNYEIINKTYNSVALAGALYETLSPLIELGAKYLM